MAESQPVSFEPKVFKDALERAAKSDAFRQELAERPLKALESIGIKLPKEYIEAIGDRPLAELLVNARVQRAVEPEVHPNVESVPVVAISPEPDVDPAVEIAVDVVVEVLAGVDPEVRPATQETVKRIAGVNRKLGRKKRARKTVRKEHK